MRLTAYLPGLLLATLLLATLLLAGGCASTAAVSPAASADCTADWSGEALTEAEVEAQGGTMLELDGGLQGLIPRIEHPVRFSTGGRQVKMLVGFVVDPSGCLQDYEVIESPVAALGVEMSAALGESVRRALMDSRFRPATVDGTPVAMRMTLPTSFRTRD